ncbi:MAG: site-2 protease family protein [Rhodobacteraceae bacterium]|nr:MAG: site-2 protease family protein [Paracoccaceae bacterium]
MQWAGWSLRLGRLAGIELRMHATFPLLFLWVGFIYWMQTGTLAGVAFGLAFIAVLFLCVVLHEYGHALTARRYGIGTRHITLLPIGGLAMLERMPKEPRQEIIVALMGPAVNVAIAIALALVLTLTGGWTRIDPETPLMMPASFLQAVLFANIFLVVFNMIPAFPMDGGRVLRATLSLSMGRVGATALAARIGQTLALGFGVLGLFGNPFLILIAVFIWIGAASEASATEIETQLHRKPASRAMITDFRVLSPDSRLSRAVNLTLGGKQKDFPVMDGPRVVGVASHTAILRGLRDHGLEGRVGDIMSAPLTADSSDDLATLLEALQQTPEALFVCILHRGELIGVIDMENITEYLRIQSALQER